MDTRKQTQPKDMEVSAGESVPMAFADSKIPEQKKVTYKGYVNFGRNNDYPSYLLGLYNKSAKHNAIINGKCVYILGNGLESDDPATTQFLARANEAQSWEDLTVKMCGDIENYGGFYLEVIPKKDGTGYNYYHTAYHKWRTNEDNSEFYYSPDWDVRWNNSADKCVGAFYPGATEKTIFYYKENRIGNTPYALPSWVACCNWIESDIEVSKATLTNAKTGFSVSKFVNFYNGDPSEEQKKNITTRLKNASTGAEGDKVWVGFNNDPSKKPTVEDLGSSDLTKEDFTQVDNLITSNIFAGHGVTHPLLFGIQQEGKLGSSQELRIAYDIFKNTYANGKQRAIECIIKRFAKIAGAVGGIKIKDVEPIGLEFSEATMLAVAPKSWMLEKLNIDPLKYPDSTTGTTPATAMEVNSVLTNLTGKQQQQILRIVRQFTQGKLSKEQAALLLKGGFGFTDDDVNAYLGIDDDPLTQDAKFLKEYDELDVALMFSEVGHSRDGYALISSKSYMEEDEEISFAFKAATELNALEVQIVDILQKDSKISNADIAKRLGVEVVDIDLIIKNLVADKIIGEAISGGGRSIIGKITVNKLPQVMIRYTYEKRPEAAGNEIKATTRPFCRKLLELNRFYTRADIQNISRILGYSVFKRAGGFWTHGPNDAEPGKRDYQCRHEWRSNVVIKK